MSTEEIVKKHYYKRREIVITCDICGSKHDSRADIKRCMVCGKDVCLGCAVAIHRDSKWWHGYNDWCCKECWSTGKERREILDAAEKIFRELVDREFAVWRQDISGEDVNNDV